jgi:membrane-associated phospholipid phosphatase
MSDEWWTWSYLIDWGVVGALGLIMGLIYGYVGPVNHFLVPNDPSLSYPHVPETVGTWPLFALIIGVPFGVMLVYLFLEVMIFKKRRMLGFLHELHTFILCFSFLLLLTLLVVQVLKVSVGYYRPNYFARPASDGQQAWPSGHSALSFACFFLQSFWLAGKTRLFVKWNALLLLVVCFSPLARALFISASRIVDYFHTPADVMTGMVIGALIACVSYSTTYESLAHPVRAGLPINRLKATGSPRQALLSQEQPIEN